MTGEGCTPQHKPILTLAPHLPGTKCFDPFPSRLTPPGCCQGRRLCLSPTSLQSLPPVGDAQHKGRVEDPRTRPPSPALSSAPTSLPVPIPNLPPQHGSSAPVLPNCSANITDAEGFDPQILPCPPVPRLGVNGHHQDSVPGSPGARHWGFGWHEAGRWEIGQCKRCPWHLCSHITGHKRAAAFPSPSKTLSMGRPRVWGVLSIPPLIPFGLGEDAAPSSTGRTSTNGASA